MKMTSKQEKENAINTEQKKVLKKLSWMKKQEKMIYYQAAQAQIHHHPHPPVIVIPAVHPHLHPPQTVNHPQVPQTVNHPHRPHHQIPAVMKKGRNVGEKERRNKSCV